MKRSTKYYIMEMSYTNNNPEFKAQAQKNVDTLLTQIEGMSDAGILSDNVVIRLGHLTHASDAALARIKSLKDKGVNIWTEANLGSNVATGTIQDGEQNSILLRSLYHGVIPTINTDGGGVMNTNLPEEYKSAKLAISDFREGIGNIPVTESNGRKVMFFWYQPSEQQIENSKIKGYEAEQLPQDRRQYFENNEVFETEGKRYRKDVVGNLPFSPEQPSRG